MNIDDKVLEIPESLPLLPIRDMVIFPYMILPLIVGRESSIRAVEEALKNNRLLFLASQKDMNEENPSPDSIYKVGTVAMILRMKRRADGRVRIIIRGIAKAKIKEFKQQNPSFEVGLNVIEDPQDAESAVELEALIRTVKEQIEKVIALGRPISPDVLPLSAEIPDPGRLADFIASNLDLKISQAQKILETEDIRERFELLNQTLTSELEVLQMQARIRNTAKDEMTKSQREYFLREQMRAIRNELGETDSKTEEIDDLREKLLRSGMPEDVEIEALKQLARLERMHPDASEASMVRTYLDWMAELPWSKKTDDNLDLKHAKGVLDSDHYDLHKVKDRILEFLAVRKLKNDMKGPILCFVGPPGVGKTSLGKSIAKSMGREYFRVALGGVKDEAEIRGHRRTYVGAMPGKIIQALKQVKTNNPVIVFDEIDKLGSDFRGDPSAAMLEVLDPEQNHTFRDNYLNVDFNLSNVLFIATANVLENIPQALRDRMEVIHLPGYTEQDKLLISRKHLIDRQIDENGITNDYIEFTDEGLRHLISHYTREAGLRNLEREVGSICRKVAKQVVLGETKKKVIDAEKVSELLGPAKYLRDDEQRDHQVGVATGLAWTQVGGEVLTIEAISMKGKGSLVLTGQLGDVMKESATAAMSYARANSRSLGIDETWTENKEVHIHIPAGAIPKDGPSAGITMATALISLMTSTQVRSDLAMTGEVTLAGRVLPVGGIREKALAALRHGIHDIIIPHANLKDLSDIPENFRKQINFLPVKHLDEVLSIAFAQSGQKKKTNQKSNKKKSTSVASSISA